MAHLDDGPLSASALRELVMRALLGDTDDLEQIWLRAPGGDSFEALGILSRDEGFVLNLGDGSQFQITIVQTRVAR